MIRPLKTGLNMTKKELCTFTTGMMRVLLTARHDGDLGAMNDMIEAIAKAHGIDPATYPPRG